MKQKIIALAPWLITVRILQLRINRYIKNLLTFHFATTKIEESLPYTSKKHQSLLRRRLGSTDPQLQENKITNLTISSKEIDGIIINPGEMFSFWKLVGKTTRKKGYIDGLLLSQGGVITGVGGGICQLANLLFWLGLHSPLQIIERHHHSFDPFPDDRRVLPFGSGASVFYNYVDLRFFNPTDQQFQFKVWVTDQHLKGTIQSDQEWPYSYHVEERNHQFIQVDDKKYRMNEIWRKIVDKKTGNIIKEEIMIKNFSEVKYDLFSKEMDNRIG